MGMLPRVASQWKLGVHRAQRWWDNTLNLPGITAVGHPNVSETQNEQQGNEGVRRCRTRQL
jgi:hypothetical protein